MINKNSLYAYKKLNLTKSQQRVYDVLKEAGFGMTMNQVSQCLNLPKNAISGRFSELVGMGVLKIEGQAIENGSRVGIYTITQQMEPDWEAMRLEAIRRQNSVSIDDDFALPF